MTTTVVGCEGPATLAMNCDSPLPTVVELAAGEVVAVSAAVVVEGVAVVVGSVELAVLGPG